MHKNISPRNPLRLPQLTAFPGESPPESFPLLVSGGRPPSAAWLQAALCLNRQEVWAIDRGIEICRETELLPALLLGDGDSARPSAWRWAAERGVPVSRYPEAKDCTDTQLALQKAAEAGHRFALLTGCFGGRLDHLYSNVISAAHAPLRCVLADERETLFFLRDGDRLELKLNAKAAALSLLPLSPACHGVSTAGLHWPLDNATLLQAKADATSNWLDSDEITVEIGSGLLGVYLTFGN